MIRFLGFLEFIFSLVLLGGFVTQVVIPLWRGTPLFPFFLREESLRRKLGEMRQRKLESDILDQIEEVKKGETNNHE